MSHDDTEPAGAHPHAPVPLRAGWKNVVLVCKACEKRNKGPKRMPAKELAKALRGACRDARVARPRIVLTSCMGACPKKAFTVAAAGVGGAVTMLAFRRGDDAAAAVDALFGAYSNSTSSTPSAT